MPIKRTVYATIVDVPEGYHNWIVEKIGMANSWLIIKLSKPTVKSLDELGYSFEFRV